MQCSKLFEEIDRLNAEYVKVWEDVCNIESPTDYKKGVDEVGNYLVKMAKHRGFDVDVLEQPVSGNAICITMNQQADAAPVCFSGHIDTVHPVGSFGTPAVKKDDKNRYGPGVYDCKGGVVASMLAMEALKNCGFTSRTVKLIIQSDEETGSKGSNKKTVEFMCEKAKGAVAFLNAEVGKKDQLVLKRKGILRYQFVVRGVAVHAAKCQEGASAVTEAAHKIIELEKWKDGEGITCNCIIISGGTASNTVPDECVFQVDVRYSNTEEYNHISKEIERVCNKTFVKGCSCTVTLESERPAMVESEINYKLLDKINDIYKKVGFGEVKAAAAPGGSDAAYITECGIPCVDSAGVIGANLHSPDEYAILDSLAETAKKLAAVAFCIE